MKTIAILTVGFIASVYSVSATPITYSFTGAAGNEASLGPDAQPVGMTAGNVSRGSGLTPTAASGTFSSSAWTTSAARDLNDYYSVSLAPDAGFQMTLTRLELDERRSLTGIRSWSIYSSIDGFASALGTFTVPDDDLTRANEGVNLGISFANLTAPVEFRIYGFQAESGAGTWRIDNLELSATAAAITSIPEGGLGWLTWLCSGLAISLYRRCARPITNR